MERVLYGLNTKAPMLMQLEAQQRKTQALAKQAEELKRLRNDVNHEYGLFRRRAEDFKDQATHELQTLKAQSEALSAKLSRKREKIAGYKRRYECQKLEAQTQTVIGMAETGRRKHGLVPLQAQQSLKMRPLEAAKDVIEAIRANPPVEKAFEPMRQMLTAVREGRS